MLHVTDASDPPYQHQLEVTDKMLKEIGADEVARIRVFIQQDLVEEELFLPWSAQ